MDVTTAYSDIHTIKKILLDMRKDPEKEFKPVFESMLAMAEIGGSVGMPIPRCGRQTARSSVEASTPEEYWQRTILFEPFLDHLIQEFEERFSQLNEDAVRGLHLLPSYISKISTEDIQAICQRFRSDLPSPEIFSQEVRRWHVLWNTRLHIENIERYSS